MRPDLLAVAALLLAAAPTPAHTVAVDHGNLMLSRPGAATVRLTSGGRDRDPALSPDGRTLYFLADAWVTSGAVHAVELATGGARYVCPGNSLEVVPRGEYAGHLMVTQHRYFVGGGSYDWYWLVTPSGEEVGPLGESTELFEESWPKQ